MSLLPTTDAYLENIPQERKSDRCHHLQTTTRLIGEVDGISAVKQACFCILATEQGIHPIYPADYGIQTFDLIGKDYSYTASELKRRIQEALLRDDRIEDVKDFEIEQIGKDSIHLSFVVDTMYGGIPLEHTAKMLEGVT